MSELKGYVQPTTQEGWQKELRAHYERLRAVGWTLREIIDDMSRGLCICDTAMWAKHVPPFYVAALRAERDRFSRLLS